MNWWWQQCLVALFLHTCCLAVDQDHPPYHQSFYLGGSHRHRHGDILRRVNRDSAPRTESVQSIRVTNSGYKIDESVYAKSSMDNENKPSFTYCSTYRPEVYENQPINTTVIQVNATDLDPVEAGGKLTYSIVDTTDDFTVDMQTGIVRTNKIFDRDEPAREKVAYVSVRATDNGKPQLDDVCNLKVIIKDINDNRPMFDKFEYRESIPRDMNVGEVVMRISATDIDDGSNGSVHYRLEAYPGSPLDLNYFDVNPDTGEVRLRQKFPDSRDAEKTYIVVGIASDKGDPPGTSTTNLSIRVVEPNQKPPYFVTEILKPIIIKELSHDPSQPVAVLEAKAGILNNSLVFYELLNGQTQATNKDSIFTSEASGNKVSIKIEKQLDYELVNEYTLTIRASNKHDLAATTVIKIQVEDENDERPFFTDVKQGSVLENEPSGTVVMRVQAIDKDGTSPNNVVSYSLGSEYIEDFQINSQTGEIRTKRPFDRESQDIFQLEVIARDGTPSATLKPNIHGLPNERREQIKIEIADKNDNPPVFEEPKNGYRAEIPENADIGNMVIEVKASDLDTESMITYSIEAGDPDNQFLITSTSQAGIITVQKNLDYETVKNYRLSVKASDSVHEAHTTVIIAISNINDNPPVFLEIDKTVTIEEETVPNGCIFNVQAYDPDIEDRRAPQGIFYFVEKAQMKDSFSVDPVDGCVRVKKPLDRDPPNGVPYHQAFIAAYDEYGNTSTKLYELLKLYVKLTDVNDNAPVLNSTNPVVWDENQPPGTITRLTALDNDDVKNGPPFVFKIASDADAEILKSFQIVENTLRATRDRFDREERKIYHIPIEITDSGTPIRQSGRSIQTVIIGDKNDSPMSDGESQISVYDYKENDTYTIGRCYVNDADDWDLPDKTFAWDGDNLSDFVLSSKDGTISIRPSASEGIHKLIFKVTDHIRNENARATVIVTVKRITEEQIDKSGSIRFYGITKEEFIETDKKTGESRRDKLHQELVRILGLPRENIDVFTVLHPDMMYDDENVVDVRFSAHGSPFYKPEKLEGLLSPYKAELEKTLDAKILMIRIDECLQENLHCEQSCFNELSKYAASYKIFTNTSSFVGVNAFNTAVCKCKAELKQHSCYPNPCFNGGVCHIGPGIDGFRCECGLGFRGSRCEVTSISFHGTGYAWYAPISVCGDSVLQLYFSTYFSNGLILYNGPIYHSSNNVSDFISLELRDGRPLFLIDFGSGVLKLVLAEGPSLSDGKEHLITLEWSPKEISMTLDECQWKEPNCFVAGQKIGGNSALNVNGPLQLGGISFDPKYLQDAYDWNYVPTTKNFTGCISNLTLNGQYYDLGDPSYSTGNVTSCDTPIAGVQIANLGVGLNFIIIVIVCTLILFLLILAVVFYRRSRKYEEVKGEPGDDVRENIINYSDEGGGEGDHAGYDLTVLMKAGTGPYISTPNGKLPKEHFSPTSFVLDDRPDLSSFLQANKFRNDNDPETLPPDDVRNYAYEGDGNSIGSLSSLASGTDDDDTNFEEFLPRFGPRFKKIADMYGGGESSDEDRSSRPSDAWC